MLSDTLATRVNNPDKKALTSVLTRVLGLDTFLWKGEAITVTIFGTLDMCNL